MTLPRIIVTGASGFVGRLLLDRIRSRFHVLALARRSPEQCGVAPHDHLEWFQVDLGEPLLVASVGESILRGGGAEAIVHLAAHYDFTGKDHPEYQRTNVHGLRHVLEMAAALRVRSFVFASSVAACPFPLPGECVDERTLPTADHPYARSKRAGEALLLEYRDRVPSCIVRFAALYSDWCEYPPLYHLLQQWLSGAWNSRMVGGRGAFALPYLHRRSAVSFLRRLLDHPELPEPCEVFVASPDGATSQREIFDLATLVYFGAPRRIRPIPKAVTRLWLRVQLLVGSALGRKPFERPWMGRYLDQQLRVDARHTRERLGWEARSRFDLLRRMPFLVDNLRTRPVRWHERNHAAMRKDNPGPELMIHWLLEKHQAAICREQIEALLDPDALGSFGSYHRLDRDQLERRVRDCMHNLRRTIRTRELAPIGERFRDLARERFREGFTTREITAAIDAHGRICLRRICADPLAAGREALVRQRLELAIQYCIDEVEDEYEDLDSHGDDGAAP